MKIAIKMLELKSDVTSSLKSYLYQYLLARWSRMLELQIAIINILLIGSSICILA